MNIQSEEILLKEFTSGTTLTFFSTNLIANQDILNKNPLLTYNPTIVELNNLGIPVSVSTFDGEHLWSLNSSNIYEPSQSVLLNFITGHSYVQKLNYIVNQERIDLFLKRFSSSIDSSLGADSGGTFPPHQDYIFPEYTEIDDFYVNIKLNRTYATLDTFNIYNNLVNSMPTQEAKTGVVFGRLTALQTIKDADGNRIKIPLRNVPVGLFNSSEDYPNPSSISDNGDRIFLNIKESVKEEDYFNIESFNLDKNQLLRSASQFTTIPEQYKYITTTNDEGEFVIYDAPIGTQIVMFEVDLLKQGLTRDEIALNYFPFPPDEDAMIDQIPNFSFKQFPINVVPAWGTIQTGYTELNVTTNLDLRKWTTYFLPPVSIRGDKLETSVAQSAANTLRVGIRNMAKEGFPDTQIKLASIQNDLDKVKGQQLNWHQEFAQVRNEVEYYKFGISIIKLPANIYDPKAFRTDKNGVPMQNQKGVWLSAYQLKIYSNSKPEIYRSSGTYRQGSNKTYSHFDLNFTTNNTVNLNHTEGIGTYPYEKPWSVEYPELYSIPRKPTQAKTRTQTPNGGYYLSEPSYLDGDLIGDVIDVSENVSVPAGGFGMQPASGIWIPNRVAHAITKDYMYKYESGVYWNEEYANGFQPAGVNPDFNWTSTVEGGEKYQRLECGYGYFCRPYGWPRVAKYPWGKDALFKPDIGAGSTSTTPGPVTVNPGYYDNLWSGPAYRVDTYNIQQQDIALALDNNNGNKSGSLDFFRVIESGDNLAPIKPFVIPTFIWLKIDGAANRVYNNGWFKITNNGEIKVSFDTVAWNSIQVFTPIDGLKSGVVSLNPGETMVMHSQPLQIQPFLPPITLENALNWSGVKLPGNSSFNTTTNRYDTASYSIEVFYTLPMYQMTYPVKNVSFSVSAAVETPNYYVKTHHSGGNSGITSLGLNTETPNQNGDVDQNRGISALLVESDNSTTTS